MIQYSVPFINFHASKNITPCWTYGASDMWEVRPVIPFIRMWDLWYLFQRVGLVGIPKFGYLKSDFPLLDLWDLSRTCGLVGHRTYGRTPGIGSAISTLGCEKPISGCDTLILNISMVR